MKCARCGEEITMPYFFEGKPFGFTCIKIVNPIEKKKAKKEYWVKADSFEFSEENKIVAFYKGKKFVDFHRYIKTVSGNLRMAYPISIFIQSNEAYINLLNYKTGALYI